VRELETNELSRDVELYVASYAKLEEQIYGLNKDDKLRFQFILIALQKYNGIISRICSHECPLSDWVLEYDCIELCTEREANLIKLEWE
jgi:hypothetical protein